MIKRDRGENISRGEEAALRLGRAERELSALRVSSERAVKDLLEARNDLAGKYVSVQYVSVQHVSVQYVSVQYLLRPLI